CGQPPVVAFFFLRNLNDFADYSKGAETAARHDLFGWQWGPGSSWRPCRCRGITVVRDRDSTTGQLRLTEDRFR
ncbi:MAG TPA: hypothetical protein PLD05_10895, partial [Thermogutta sp.]|nr:hypothetical protein [Thermogutta sp.]